MTDAITHDEEVRELFEKVTVEIPECGGLRAINLQGFKLAIDRMMNKAFYMGSRQTLQSAEEVIDKVFNRLQ